ncbi:MAG: inositol monophosphatase family protein [bacterium]
MVNINPQDIAQEIASIAEQEILPRFNNLQSHDISTKTSPTDLVTAADIEAEKQLEKYFTSLISDSIVIGEEGVSQYPERLAQLSDTGIYWIIDPVDGTRNFVHGKDRFGTMVALVIEGQTKFSWIYMPLLDQCAIAEDGNGAYWRGERLINPIQTPVNDAIGDYNPRFIPPAYLNTFGKAIKQFHSYRRGGCSAWDYLDIATGEIDFVLTGKLMPWDHAAGVLLVQEAGGRTALLDSQLPYRPVPLPDQPMLTSRTYADWSIYAEALMRGTA